MSISRAKLLVGSGAIALSLAYLGWTGLRSGWVYYVDVDGFVAAADPTSQRVRVHGVVSPDGLVVERDRLFARFMVTGTNSSLQVEFHGAIPELFGAGRQVVVEGVRQPDGVFRSDLMLTKCASKYEAAAGSAGPSGGASPPSTVPDP